MFRDSTSCTSMSAVSTPMPTTRASSRTMACGPFAGACARCSSRVCSISRISFIYDLVALQIALERGQRVRRDRLALGRA